MGAGQPKNGHSILEIAKGAAGTIARNCSRCAKRTSVYLFSPVESVLLHSFFASVSLNCESLAFCFAMQSFCVFESLLE